MQNLDTFISDLGAIWGVPDFASSVSIRLSTRQRRTLGKYRARTAEITVAACLIEADDQLLREVLCHEAAHAAVRALHGAGLPPHGPEWRSLMAKAGFPARATIPLSDLPATPNTKNIESAMWEHRCPVCQATRYARTRVTRWRCHGCRTRGDSGALMIRLITQDAVEDS